MVYSPFCFYHAYFFMKEKEYVLKSPVSLEAKSSANLWSIKEILKMKKWSSQKTQIIYGSNPIEDQNFFFLNFFFQASLRHCINCIHCDDHFFIFNSFLLFILYDLFHISLTKEILLHSNIIPGIEGSKSFCSIFWVFYS